MSELVDKQAVLRAINELSFVGYLNEDDIRDAVEWLPVVDERKKGKWIKRDVSLYRCSECGRFSPSQENYCPSCGLDMREENENEKVK